MSSGAGGGGADGASSSRSGGGGGIRGFFNKLRKPSSQNMGNGASSGSNSNLRVSIGNKTYDASDVQRLIPDLEKGIEERDRRLKNQDQIINGHITKITKLESDVKTLQSECDKLRSVLQQKADSAANVVGAKSSRSSDELRASLQAEVKMLGQDGEHPKVVQPGPNSERQKKIAVSAEPTREQEVSLVHHPKTPGAKQLIRNAVQQNDFLRQLDQRQVVEMVECMYEKEVKAGDWVIKEGEAGSHLYVAAAGELQVSREGNVLGKMGSGRVFGELAILYNCTRTASVQALSDAQLWVLDRPVFQMITMRMGMERQKTIMDFLRKVGSFKHLPEDKLSKISDVLDQDFFGEGTVIIREGEKGNTFFIISSGEVKVTQMLEGHTTPQEIRVLKQGDFFGEKALLGEEVRTASVIALAPGVEALTLDRDSFTQLIGDMAELRKDYGDEGRKVQSTPVEPPSPVKTVPQPSDEFAQVQLSDLNTISTLGVGGFGRVELVCIGKDKSRTFALKALKKKHIVDTRQQEHIFAERNIMMEMRSEWIVGLYKTFRDRKYVYMLLEACLGGELWTTLRDRGHFDDFTARFYVACVLEGLEYLHRKKVIYRDLKPENCLLNNHGYLKLVDFGFAKKLPSGRKTWTFCGTPEYVSPEIILNKGHDQAADFWALGIYICELLLGRPPFQASDPMKTYTLILKGVDALDIPNRRIGRTVTSLVKKLCRDNPGERLGCQSGGVEDIRKHKWFMGFDWDGLRSRTLRPPILPKVSGPADMSNFDHYPPDENIPPDEFSGWDDGF